MPKCPHCHEHFLRRKRIDGTYACPGCRAPVVLFEGEWYDNRPKAPSKQLLDLFMELFERKNGGAKLHLEGNGWKEQLSRANTYLKKCGGDLDIAKEAMRVQFQHPRFTWANRQHMGYLFHDVYSAAAIARRNRTKQEKAKRRTSAFLAGVNSRENVFAGGL